MKHIKKTTTEEGFNANLFTIKRPWVMLLSPNIKISHTCLRFRLINVQTGDSISGNGDILVNNETKSYITDNNGLFVVPDVIVTKEDLTIQLKNFTGTKENPETGEEQEFSYQRYTEIVKFDNIFDSTIGLKEGNDSDDEITLYVNWKHEDYENPTSESDYEYDIDTHAVIYNGDTRLYEVYYSRTTYEDENIYVNLDLDDTGSDNGETLTIRTKTPLGANYVIYYIMYDYENGESPVSNPFKDRNCSAVLLDKDGQTVRLNPPTDIDDIATTWKICTLKNGRILETVNEITNDNSGNWAIIRQNDPDPYDEQDEQDSTGSQMMHRK